MSMKTKFRECKVIMYKEFGKKKYGFKCHQCNSYFKESQSMIRHCVEDHKASIIHFELMTTLEVLD